MVKINCTSCSTKPLHLVVAPVCEPEPPRRYIATSGCPTRKSTQYRYPECVPKCPPKKCPPKRCPPKRCPPKRCPPKRCPPKKRHKKCPDKKCFTKYNPTEKCFPVVPYQPLYPGDIVAIGKGSDEATAHKLLCEQWEWAAAINGPGDEQRPKITVDNCGNIYVAGFGSSGTRPEYFNSDTTLQGRGKLGTGDQIFIGRLDKAGTWQWAAAIDGTGVDELPEITTDSCGNIYVSGRSTSKPFFFSASPQGGVNPNNPLMGRDPIGQSTLYVGKLDPTGKWQFVAGIDNGNLDPKEECISDLAADSCGNIYVTGSFKLQPFFLNTDSSGNISDIVTVIGLPENKAFVAKLKPTGVWEWAAAVDSLIDTSISIAKPSITVGSCGSIYVASINVDTPPNYYSARQTSGSTNSTAQFTAADKNGVDDIVDLYVGKIDCNGVWEWAASVGGLISGVVETIEILPSVAADNFGNIYVSGFSSGTPKFYNEGSGNYSIEGKDKTGSNLQLFVGKLKCNGVWEWASAVDGGLVLIPSSLDTDCCGNVYVTATNSQSPSLFYPAVPAVGNTSSSASISGLNFPGVHIFVSKLTPNGSWEWVASVADRAADVSFPDVAVDNCGNIYVTAEVAAETTGGPLGLFDAAANGDTLTDPSLFGKPSEKKSVFVGKIANEAKSVSRIGMVQSVNTKDETVCINISGSTKYKKVIVGPEYLEPGCDYYIDCTRNRYYPYVPHCPSLTTDNCSGCCCPNRCVGLACDKYTLIWDLERPLCDKKKGCCCCNCKKTEDVESSP